MKKTMIDQEFDVQNIQAVNLGVSLKGNAQRYFIPSDAGTKSALRSILSDTVNAFEGVATAWEVYDISEDYGSKRRIYSPRDNEYMTALSEIFDVGALPDLTNLNDHVSEIEFYFGEFTDNQGRKAVGIRKATQLKATLTARNRLVRLVNDTVILIEEDTLKLDPQYDVIVTDANIFILNPRNVELVAQITEHVAATATAKVQHIQDTVLFLDMTRIQATIARHPQMARHAASIAANPNLANFQQARIEEMAVRHGIVFKTLADGRLQCRVQDHARLLEILDARRYHLDLAGNGGDPYRATGRQKVSA
ncbi:Kiwa anti-phage protein KwaB-like domain-containing protein [Rhizobium etli]|nr:Kiwa anti-phage protein KwaB-like domain-containing protein [Rhizobium etli]